MWARGRGPCQGLEILRDGVENSRRKCGADSWWGKGPDARPGTASFPLSSVAAPSPMGSIVAQPAHGQAASSRSGPHAQGQAAQSAACQGKFERCSEHDRFACSERLMGTRTSPTERLIGSRGTLRCGRSCWSMAWSTSSARPQMLVTMAELLPRIRMIRVLRAAQRECTGSDTESHSTGLDRRCVSGGRRRAHTCMSIDPQRLCNWKYIPMQQ